MGIKLIKRCDQKVEEEKASQPSSSNDMTLTAQSWVKEFRERKSRLSVNPFVSKKDLTIPQPCTELA